MKRRSLLNHLAHSPLGWLALSLGPMQLARGATVLAVRVWPASDYTRVAIESDTPLKADHFLTATPPRLVINFTDQELTPELRDLVGKIKPDDPYIAGVRIGQYQPNVVRMVVDLKQAIKPQQFTLTPAASYQYRLVFDLYPEQERDPLQALQALTRDKPSASTQADIPALNDANLSPPDTAAGLAHSSSRQAPSSSADPLGGLLEQIERKPADRTSGRTTARTPTPPGARGSTASPSSHASARNRLNQLVIVALDPGHGGEDPGATGPSGLHEKDVVLDIAQQLHKRLNSRPGMRAMLTRDADFYVPLHERVVKARKVKADLFISIHADAFARPEAHGASVFTLSTSGASSTTARWLAQKENAADLVGGVNTAVKDEYVLRTMLDMSTAAQIRDSMNVGKEVLARIGAVGDLHKGNVEQAGFAVLKAPDIPSILVETAFISNPQEEKKLKSDAYQRQIVDALVAGIERYFAKNPPLSRRRMA